MAQLKTLYNIYRNAGKLDELAVKMRRRKTSICRAAERLGLTDPKGAKQWFRKWKGMDEETARVIFEQFKAVKMGVGKFCKKHHYDDLGFSKTMKEFFPDEWEHVIEAKMPRQSMYRLGRSFEYRVRDDLRRKGYFVLRSPRSLSPVDLVAIKKNSILLMIQCKRSGECPLKDWNGLFDLADSTGALPVLAGMPGTRGIQYWHLVDRKDGSKRTQPRAEITIGQKERSLQRGGR